MNKRTRRGVAFTITELLVVISIMVLLIAIAVPAFSSLMNSSERSLAENQLRAAIAAARDAAIQSETGDAAAVFFYNIDPQGRGSRVTIVPCVVVGQIQDTINSNGTLGMRDVFVPIPTIEPVQLPRGWSVRAYAAPGTVYDGTPSSELWYERYVNPTAQAGAPGWVFPETAFYDTSTAGAALGSYRQSFMVRFKVGTGALDTASGGTALVFAPVLDSTFRAAAPFSLFRADQLRIAGTPPIVAPNAATWVRRVLTDRPDLTPAFRRQLLGDSSLDTVLVRPVTELALYQEQKMAASIGATGLNRMTNTIYGNPTNAAVVPTYPTLDTGLFPPSGSVTADQVADRVNQWIEGQYRVGGTPAGALVASDARIFTLEHYLGQIQELVP